MSLRILFYETNFATKLSLVFICCILCAAFLVTLYAINPNLFDYGYVLKIFGRDESMTGRTQLWKMAMNAFNTKMFFGWGFDNLGSLFQVGNYKHKLIYGQFHNGYLDLLVRGGIVGFILTGLLIGYTLISLLRSRSDISTRSFTVLCVVFVLLHNISEASIMRSPSLQWLILLIIFYAGYYESHKPMPRHLIHRRRV